MDETNETQTLTPSSAQKPTKACPKCGQEIASNAKKCRYCGEWLEKQCPYCGEWINAKAEKCKHCGNWLSEIARRKYENRMGITRDREKAQQGRQQLSDNDKTVLKFIKITGCLMHVENIVLAACLIGACGFNFIVGFLCCFGFYILMSFSAVRKLYSRSLISI